MVFAQAQGDMQDIHVGLAAGVGLLPLRSGPQERVTVLTDPRPRGPVAELRAPIHQRRRGPTDLAGPALLEPNSRKSASALLARPRRNHAASPAALCAVSLTAGTKGIRVPGEAVAVTHGPHSASSGDFRPLGAALMPPPRRARTSRDRERGDDRGAQVAPWPYGGKAVLMPPQGLAIPAPPRGGRAEPSSATPTFGSGSRGANQSAT
jgi:hypothetical protein